MRRFFLFSSAFILLLLNMTFSACTSGGSSSDTSRGESSTTPAGVTTSGNKPVNAEGYGGIIRITGVSRGTLVGVPGTQLKIEGQNFQNPSFVTVNGISCLSPLLLNPKTLLCTLPPEITELSVIVLESHGDTAKLTLPPTSAPPAPLPQITSVTPGLSGLTGGVPVTINGSDFLPGAMIRFGETPCAQQFVQYLGSTTIKCLQNPAGIGVNSVSVINPDSQFALFQGAFTYSQDRWTQLNTLDSLGAPVIARCNHSAVWADNVMIVFGGWTGVQNTGARFDPISNSWTVISPVLDGQSSPLIVYPPKAVWTGTEMFVWGNGVGARYNPLTDTWVLLSTTNAPANGSLFWTQNKLVVYHNAGVSEYTTANDTWATYNPVGAPSTFGTAVLIGSKLIVWGGQTVVTNGGGIYDIGLRQWAPISNVGSPTARAYHSAISTGNKMIVWGGAAAGYIFQQSGGIYDPNTDVWTPTSIGPNTPAARWGHTAVWTGGEMLIWGGYASTSFAFPYEAVGGRYNPGTNTWQSMSVTNQPDPRHGMSAVWTGDRMLVFGGTKSGLLNPVALNTGAAYFP